MTRKKKLVEVFVNSDKGVVKDSHKRNLPPFRGIYGKKSETWEVEKNLTGLSEIEIEIISWLESIEGSHNFELKVYDIEKSTHALHALKNKVEKIPSIIIEEHKFEGEIDKSQILKILI